MSIKIDLIPEFFSSSPYCSQVDTDLKTIGSGWMKIESGTNGLDINRGIFVTSLMSTFKIESTDVQAEFRNVLYVGSTEDICEVVNSCSYLPIQDERIRKSSLSKHDFSSYEHIEVWFLPVPNIGLEFINESMKKLIELFNPPFNRELQHKIKARSVNRSVPAF